MKRTTKYVALDVHQASTVSSVREEGGRVIARTIIPTEASAVVEFFRGMRGAIHVTFEEGTQAQWLHDLIAPVVARVIVCDRRGERRRRGNKNDLADADELSEQLRLGGLRAVYHGNTHRVRLKELTRAYQNLVEDATRVMLRLKALFRARGIKPSVAVRKKTAQPRHKQLAGIVKWLASKCSPVFHSRKVMAASLRVRVTRANGSCIPFATR